MPLNNEKLNEFLLMIENSPLSRSESVCGKIADEFENDLMEVDGFPSDHFIFIQELFSNSRFFEKPGIWNFLMVLSAGKHRLKSAHYEKMAEIFEQNFVEYKDPDLCLAVCDFVARNFQHSAAKRLLNEFRVLENHKPENLHGISDEGLQILKNEIERQD